MPAALGPRLCPNRSAATSRQGRSLPHAAGLGILAAAAIVGACPSAALAQNLYFEQEPNDTRATATVIPRFAPGDLLTAISFGNTPFGLVDNSPDFFDLRPDAPGPATGPLAPVVLEVDFVLSNPRAADFAMSLRGLLQSAGTIFPTQDILLQTSLLEGTGSTQTRRCRAYVTGWASPKLIVRINGRSTVLAPYQVATAARLVTPLRFDRIAPGPVTITTVNQGHGTDTDLWLFTQEGTPIPDAGNDDTPQPISPRSTLTRNLAAGRYLLALTDSDLCVSLASPADDANRSRPVTDDPGVIIGTSAAVNVPLNVRISSVGGTGYSIPLTKTEPFQVFWLELFVGVPIPAPTTGCNPADLADGGGNPPGDGTLDGSDFIAFINAFASDQPLADIVDAGGSTPGDGTIDGSDFIAFINNFAAGC